MKGRKPAFPSHNNHSPDETHNDGLSLRDYFAIRIFVTAMAENRDTSMVDDARWAYFCADTLIEASKCNSEELQP